jgi:hypothetical protein
MCTLSQVKDLLGQIDITPDFTKIQCIGNQQIHTSKDNSQFTQSKVLYFETATNIGCGKKHWMSEWEE